jgi:hypothetical protein
LGVRHLMGDGSQTGAGSRNRDSEDEREWIPREISDAPPYLFARTQRENGEGRAPESEAAPFDRSMSRLRKALGDLSGAEAESPLELRIREAKERGSELEQRIRAAEERVARALRAVDKNALEVKTIISTEPEKPTEHNHTKGTAAPFNSFE